MKEIFTFFLLITSIAFSQGKIIEDSFYSNSLDETRKFNIYLPEYYNPNDTTQRFPVVYHLHSNFGDQTELDWHISTVLNELITNNKVNPMIVVKPYSNLDPETFKLPWVSSWYANSELHGLFEDYLVYDLLNHVDSIYNTISVKEKRSLLGFSMGGYGALMLGFKYPENYMATASLDGPVSFTRDFETWWTDSIQSEYSGKGPFDPEAGWNTEDMFAISGSFSPNLNKPPYFVDLPLDTNFILIDSIMKKWRLHYISSLAYQYSRENDLKIYMDSGTDTLLTNYSSIMDLIDTFETLEIPYEFNSYSGGHSDSLRKRLSLSLTYLDSVMWAGYPRSYNRTISPTFAKMEEDTVYMSTNLTNPNNHLLLSSAMILGSNGLLKDEKKMMSGENEEWVVKWLAPIEEDFFRVDLSIVDKDMQDRKNRIFNVVQYTTIPLKMTYYEIEQINDNDLKIANIEVKNMSQKKIIPTVSLQFHSDDTSATIISAAKSMGDFRPQEAKIINSMYVKVDIIKNYKFIAEISSNDIVYWRDTIEFNPTNVDLVDNLPIEYALEQNYPNPFNPSTTIKYSLPRGEKRETSNVKLIVYDILGKDVRTLVNEKQNLGYYEITWDGTNQPSGVYFYKLDTGDYVETKKMVLLR